MGERESFVFYRSFYDALQKSTPKIRHEVLDAILQYSFKGNLPKMSGMADVLFTLIKPQLDANNKRYEVGKGGGRPTQITDEIKKQIVFDCEHGMSVDKLAEKYNCSKRTIYNMLSLQKQGSVQKPMDIAQSELKKPMDIANDSVQKPNVNENVNVNENENENVNDNNNDNVNVNVNGEDDENSQTVVSAHQPTCYGVFKNVVLTNFEYDMLKRTYPNNCEAMIDKLSTHMQETGNNYAGMHRQILVKWAIEDMKKGK